LLLLNMRPHLVVDPHLHKQALHTHKAVGDGRLGERRKQPHHVAHGVVHSELLHARQQHADAAA